MINVRTLHYVFSALRSIQRPLKLHVPQIEENALIAHAHTEAPEECVCA